MRRFVGQVDRAQSPNIADWHIFHLISFFDSIDNDKGWLFFIVASRPKPDRNPYGSPARQNCDLLSPDTDVVHMAHDYAVIPTMSEKQPSNQCVQRRTFTRRCLRGERDIRSGRSQ